MKENNLSHHSELKKNVHTTVLFKKCHICGHIIESEFEAQRCESCEKSFLPLNYFSKIHDENIKTTDDFKQLFDDCNALCEEDLIKGIHVLW